MTQKKQAIVVNLIGGPGIGKTIITSELFAAIKRNFITCEVSREVIKDLIREQQILAMNDQLKIFTEQYFRLKTLKEDVQVVVTDSPLIFCAIYDKDKCQFLKALIMDKFNKCINLNYYLMRDSNVPYEQNGRYQNVEGAKKVDDEVLNFLKEEKITYKEVYGIGPDTLKLIVDDVIKNLNEV